MEKQSDRNLQYSLSRNWMQPVLGMNIIRGNPAEAYKVKVKVVPVL